MATPNRETIRNSRQRLAQISHHFLSETNDKQPPVNNSLPFLLLIYAEESAHPPPVSAQYICQALHNKGHPNMLLERMQRDHHPRHIRCSFFQTFDTTAKILCGHTENWHPFGTPTPWKHQPELLITPINTVDPDLLAIGQRILLPVHASTQGLKQAYLTIKRMSSLIKPRMIAITIHGTHDRQTARTAFRQLAVASLRFLGIKLQSYSCVLEGDSAASAENDIADLILTDWREWKTSTIKPATLHS